MELHEINTTSINLQNISFQNPKKNAPNALGINKNITNLAKTPTKILKIPAKPSNQSTKPRKKAKEAENRERMQKKLAKKIIDSPNQYNYINNIHKCHNSHKLMSSTLANLHSHLQKLKSVENSPFSKTTPLPHNILHSTHKSMEQIGKQDHSMNLSLTQNALHHSLLLNNSNTVVPYSDKNTVHSQIAFKEDSSYRDNQNVFDFNDFNQINQMNIRRGSRDGEMKENYEGKKGKMVKEKEIVGMVDMGDMVDVESCEASAAFMRLNHLLVNLAKSQCHTPTPLLTTNSQSINTNKMSYLKKQTHGNHTNYRDTHIHNHSQKYHHSFY